MFSPYCDVFCSSPNFFFWQPGLLNMKVSCSLFAPLLTLLTIPFLNFKLSCFTKLFNGKNTTVQVVLLFRRFGQRKAQFTLNSRSINWQLGSILSVCPEPVSLAFLRMFGYSSLCPVGTFFLAGYRTTNKLMSFCFCFPQGHKQKNSFPLDCFLPQVQPVMETSRLTSSSQPVRLLIQRPGQSPKCHYNLPLTARRETREWQRSIH